MIATLPALHPLGVWPSFLQPGRAALGRLCVPALLGLATSISSAQVLPDAAADSGSRAYTGARLSLQVQDMPVRALLQQLADMQGFNLVASDSVEGRLTLRLHEVPWDQALDIVLQSRGLGARRVGEVLLVAPWADIAAREQALLETRRRLDELQAQRTEAFQLHHAKADDVARALLGYLAGAVATSSGAAGSSAPGGPQAASGGSPRTSSARSAVIAVARTNQLFITDVPARLDQARQMISRMDVPLRQVQIEARIVEANEGFGRSLGTRLGLGARPAATPALAADLQGGRVSAVVGGSDVAAGLQSGQLTMPAPQSPEAFSSTRFVNLPAPSLAGADPASIAWAIFAPSAHRFLNLELSALEADGQGKVVSSPRVVTGDQVEESIKQGFRIPYRGVGSAGGQSPQVQFQEASLRLTVTPQITPDGQVNMNLLITKDSLGAVTPDGREINTKELRTHVRVEDGGTVVIGGIHEQEDVGAGRRVPWLGTLPLLGSLFRSRTTESRRTELLVFITPRLLEEPPVSPGKP